MLLLATPLALGFATVSLPVRTTAITSLFNVPPPAETDRAAFEKFASQQPPPSSFFELQQDCQRSVRIARQDGHLLLEVEFPPLPAAVLEMDDVSSYEVARANLELALDFSKGLIATDDGVNKVAILFPDQAELNIALENAAITDNPQPGVVVSSLLQPSKDDDRVFKPEQIFLNLMGQRQGQIQKIEDADVYVILTASAQELPDVRALHELDPDKTIVCFNLKLDVLRGDLGAPAFPPKEFQDEFLSRVKPAYYLRTRQYTRSTSRPPFLVNFQGCLFRAYPGQYQTLLDTGTGRYRRVQSNSVRPALGAFKQELIDELVNQDVLQDEGNTLNFLRTGYKTTTWWEEERPDASDTWLT